MDETCVIWTGRFEIILCSICFQKHLLSSSPFVGILTFTSRKNSIIGLSEPEKKSEFLDIFIPMSI